MMLIEEVLIAPGVMAAIEGWSILYAREYRTDVQA